MYTDTIFKWFLRLPEAFAAIGEFLTQPLLYPDMTPVIIAGLEVNMLSLVSVGVLGAVIVFKIVDLVVPT